MNNDLFLTLMLKWRAGGRVWFVFDHLSYPQIMVILRSSRENKINLGKRVWHEVLAINKSWKKKTTSEERVLFKAEANEMLDLINQIETSQSTEDLC